MSLEKKTFDIEEQEEVTVAIPATQRMIGEGGAGGEGEEEAPAGAGPPELNFGAIMKVVMPQHSVEKMQKLYVVSMVGQLATGIIGLLASILSFWPVMLIPVIGVPAQIFTRTVCLYNICMQTWFSLIPVYMFLGNKDKESGAKIIEASEVMIYIYVSILNLVASIIMVIIFLPWILGPVVCVIGTVVICVLVYVIFLLQGWIHSCLCWPCDCIMACAVHCGLYWGSVFMWIAVTCIWWAQAIIPMTWAGTVAVFVVADILASILFLVYNIIGLVPGIVGIVMMWKFHKAKTAPAPSADYEATDGQ